MKIHLKALPTSRYPSTPRTSAPLYKFKKKLFPGPTIFENFKLLFKEILCRYCGSLLTKSDNKPTYQSPENRAPHNFTFFDLGDKPLRYGGHFFMSYDP